MKYACVLIGVLICLLSACDESELTPLSTCELKAVVDENQFKNAPEERMTIHELEIEGDCLRVKVGASGCSSEYWKVSLIGSEFLVETYPAIRYVMLSLKNKEDCLAYFTKEVTFDISNLRAGGDEVVLKFLNSDHQIRYKY